MRLHLIYSSLVFSLLLVFSSQLFNDYAKTFIRQHCQKMVEAVGLSLLSRPELMNVSDITLTKYASMQQIRLLNLGGDQLHYCDGFNFPNGLTVKLTRDGRSCKISGAPLQAQATTNAYVVTANMKGRSLAVVPIEVNALVLRE